MARESIGYWMSDGIDCPKFRVDIDYEIFMDMVGSQQSQLTVDHVQINPKGLSADAFKALWPITIKVTIGTASVTGTAKYVNGFNIGSFSSSKRLNIPTIELGQTFSLESFDIDVEIKARGETPVTFTQTGYATFKNSILGPTSLTQYQLHNYTFGRATPSSGVDEPDLTSSFFFRHYCEMDYYTAEYAYLYGYSYARFEDVYTSETQATIAPIKNAYTQTPEMPGDYVFPTQLWLQTNVESEDFWEMPISAAKLEVQYVSSYGGAGAAFKPNVDALTVTGDNPVQGTNEITHEAETAYIQKVSTLTVSTFCRETYGGGIDHIDFYADEMKTVKPPASDGGAVSVDLVFTTSGEKTIRAVVHSTIGTSTEVTATVRILPYTPPRLTGFTVHRCSPRTSGSSTSDFVDAVTGNRYIADDQGTYCAVRTTSAFQSFVVMSSGGFYVVFTPTTDNSLTNGVRVNPQNGEDPSEEYTYTPGGYTYTYTKVISAPTETSFIINAYLSDSILQNVIFTKTVSTAGVIMDFLSGGKGLAIGRVAQNQQQLDIAPSWDMRVYEVVIGNYTPYDPNNVAQDGQELNLKSWMRQIEAAIASLQQT